MAELTVENPLREGLAEQRARLVRDGDLRRLGDLANRKLVPALYNLARAGCCPPVRDRRLRPHRPGVEGFREELRERCEVRAPRRSTRRSGRASPRAFYVTGTFDDPRRTSS